MIIAGGAVALLIGIGFIVLSSNDEIAQVIHEVEREAAQESVSNNATSTEEVATAEGTPSAAAQRTAHLAPAPRVNQVILGEIESGNVITVPQATLLEGGYVVLYKVDSRGEASVVGESAFLSEGTHTNIRIQLDNGPVAELQAIAAILHADDGDEKFEYPGPDRHLTNGSLIASDIDVVGISRSDHESRVLETQVEAFLETNFKD